MLPRPKVRTGHISDVMHIKQRRDWSWLRDKILMLEPGRTESVRCPPYITIPALRSVILTAGKRYHKGFWRVTTRTEGKIIHIFLGPSK